VLVPRHPQRFDEVAAMLEKFRLNYVRRSAWPDDGAPLPADVEVVLGDSMGEMAAYFSAADMAFIGGSLLPLGGQNLIEACAAGTPVIFGPHMFNFTQASENALAAGAARRVSDASELATSLADLLVNDDRRLAMRTAATLFARQHQGATGRTVGALGRWLEAAVA
jgi:3-deoxy-D-manno-octulosonic-acid transferase